MWIIILLVVLTIVAVVGHLIWLAVSWLFRVIFDISNRDKTSSRIHCVWCNRLTDEFEKRCDFCGHDLRDPDAKELSDLAAVERQATRLREHGLLTQAAAEQLLTSVQQRRRRIHPSYTEPKAAEEPIVVAEFIDRPSPKSPPTTAASATPDAPAGSPFSSPTAKSADIKPKPTTPAKPEGYELQPTTPDAVKPRTVPKPSPVAKAPAAEKPPAAAKPSPKPPPKPPRKPWSERLTGFLEQRNVHWIELVLLMVGGILLVGPSVALVISLWPDLEQKPYLKSFVFVAYSSVIFLTGLYAHQRWKLESTGRALLIVATLLVPLDFLATAGLSRTGFSWTLVATELVSLGIFAWLVGLAAKVLVPEGRWNQVLAVVGNSAVMLLMVRLIVQWPDTWSRGPGLTATGMVPVVLFATAVGLYLRKTWHGPKLARPQADALLTLLGIGAFALAVTLGPLMYRGLQIDNLTTVWNHLSILVTTTATIILIAGLTVVRRIRGDDGLGIYQAVGTTVALVAVGIMFIAMGLAWPQPAWIVAIGTFNLVVMALIAVPFRLPAAHAGAMVFAVPTYLVAFHGLAGHLKDIAPELLGSELFRLALGGVSGAALVGLAGVAALTAELFVRIGRHRHARYYAVGSLVIAATGLSLVTWEALRSPAVAWLAASVWGLYGIMTLAGNARLRRPTLSYVGLGLLAGATLWVLRWRFESFGPSWSPPLAAEALVLAVAGILLGRAISTVSEPSTRRLLDVYRLPVLHVAEAIAGLAVAVALWTAWTGRASIDHTFAPVATAALAAGIWIALALVHRSPARAYVGLTIGLVGLIHTYVWNYTSWVDWPWPIAFLLHASMGAVGAAGLAAWVGRGMSGVNQPLRDNVRRSLIQPLGDMAVISCTLATLALLFGPWSPWHHSAALFFWLGCVWLLMAWHRRIREVLAVAQIAWTIAVMMAATGWLEGRSWVAQFPEDLWNSRSLQVYGIALGSMSLAWLVARIVLARTALARMVPAGNVITEDASKGNTLAETVPAKVAVHGDKPRSLLTPDGFSVDRVIRHAVVWGQLVVVALALLPCVMHELNGKSFASSKFAAFGLAAVGATAWTLLGLTALMLIVTLWYRWRWSLTGSVITATMIAWLAAGQAANQQAVASALRWGLSIGFILCSVVVWYRNECLRVIERFGTRIDVGPRGPRLARTTLLLATVMPVLLMTGSAGLLRLEDVTPGGPAAESFFAQLGTSASYLIPLTLVVLGLVGHAIRERSAVYAFSAGLVVQMAVVLGYLHGVGRLGTAEWAHLVQCMAIAAAMWGLAWLIVRRTLDVWREGRERSSGRALMDVQFGMAAAANALLLIPALLALIFGPDNRHPWTEATGSWLGWLAFVVSVAAVVYRPMQLGRRPQPATAGLIGMAGLGLLATTVHGLAWLNPPWLEPQWGYRVLMLGWAVYACLVAVATWWAVSQRTVANSVGPPQGLLRAANVWVIAAGSAAVVLGLKAAALHRVPEDLLWAAGAIATSAVAGAIMAVWRRREGWAFAAALGVNLAASLVVWFYRFDMPLAEWQILLIEANVIATSTVALVWAAARRRLYQLREIAIGDTPMLALQTGLAVAGMAVLIVPAAIGLMLEPGWTPGWLWKVAQAPGWVAMLLTFAAVAWYLRQVLPAGLIHALGGLALGTVVLGACASTSSWMPSVNDDWLAYHLLMAGLAVAGWLLLATGWLGQNLRLTGQFSADSSESTRAGEMVFPQRPVAQWVTVLGTMAVTLAVTSAVFWCRQDPIGPWWSAGTLVGVSLGAGCLAIWQRLPHYVYASGLVLNVAGTIAWLYLGPEGLGGLVAANVLALAAASIGWSLVGLVTRSEVPTLQFDDLRPPFASVAARIGLVLLGGLAVAFVAADLIDVEHQAVGRTTWIALGAITLAAVLRLADRSCRPPRAFFYFAGLTGWGLTLTARALSPQTLLWNAGAELAAFMLIAALLDRLVAATAQGRWLFGLDSSHPDSGHPDSGHVHWIPEWFTWCQAVLAITAGVLGIWMSMDPRLDGLARIDLTWLSGRVAGPVAMALLFAGTVLMAGRSRGGWRAAWQYAAVASGGLVPAAVGWSWLEAGTPMPWIYRNVILMTATVATAIVARFAPGWLPSGANGWGGRILKTVPVSATASLVMLATVLVQEIANYQPGVGMPLAVPAVVAVGTALGALIVLVLNFAVFPDRDPLGLSDRGRTAYVYAAEVLCVLVGVHLRLTMPDLFQLGIVEKYWMLMLMGVAFGGAGLSEWFRRRDLPVLSEPLERTAVMLPLVAAAGFLLLPMPEAPVLGLAGKSPVIWFLAAIFYGILAASKRSVGFGVLAAVAGNGGLWVLWSRLELDLWERPQLWLIPVGLSILAAELINHRRLSSAQSSTMRYLGLALIYIPSCSEFLRAVGESLWLPLVLIGLSVAGVLAGVMLRVRSFMLTGITFLFVVVLTMIKYAAVDLPKTWIFSLCCIGLGLTIFVGIAVFEKHREDILDAVKKIQQWDEKN